MKRIIFTIAAAISATAFLSGCSDRPWDFVFKDFFVAVKSEAGAEASQVLSTSDNFVVQYPVNLVSSERSEDLVVTFEVVPGNGLWWRRLPTIVRRYLLAIYRRIIQ